jgi:hypothetical protein
MILAAIAGLIFGLVWSAVSIGWAASDAISESHSFEGAPITIVVKANPFYWLTLWLFTSKERDRG